MLDFGVFVFFAHPFCFSCPAGEKPSQVEKSQAKEAALDASQALEAALLSEESVVALCEPTTSCKFELGETGSTCSFGQQINMTQPGIYLEAVCQASSSRMCRVFHRILGRAKAEVEQPQVGRFLAMIQFLGRVFTSIFPRCHEGAAPPKVLQVGHIAPTLQTVPNALPATVQLSGRFGLQNKEALKMDSRLF